MSKIVLVETISTFRHVYAVRLPDDEPNQNAIDDVVWNVDLPDSSLTEVTQNHISEEVFSHHVVTEDEYIELFDREKLLLGITRACEKRPVSRDAIEGVVYDIERALRDSLRDEVSSTLIGDKVMRRLRDLDEVAYVRFASVYKEFQDLISFLHEIERLLERARRERQTEEQQILFDPQESDVQKLPIR